MCGHWFGFSLSLADMRTVPIYSEPNPISSYDIHRAIPDCLQGIIFISILLPHYWPFWLRYTWLSSVHPYFFELLWQVFMPDCSFTGLGQAFLSWSSVAQRQQSIKISTRWTTTERYSLSCRVLQIKWIAALGHLPVSDSLQITRWAWLQAMIIHISLKHLQINRQSLLHTQLCLIAVNQVTTQNNGF
jgi:hypothetical protein